MFFKALFFTIICISIFYRYCTLKKIIYSKFGAKVTPLEVIQITRLFTYLLFSITKSLLKTKTSYKY